MLWWGTYFFHKGGFFVFEYSLGNVVHFCQYPHECLRLVCVICFTEGMNPSAIQQLLRLIELVLDVGLVDRVGFSLHTPGIFGDGRLHLLSPLLVDVEGKQTV